ncbi:MAG: hypothetical protein GX221_04055 [Candidatus Riflebacteria bacterium]|nr:hypothetical protein [Candidatus Riflebacteria bacterium]
MQALLLQTFYGFGMSAINNFVYTRMYALFTVFALGLLLAILKLDDKQAYENKYLFAISSLIFLGCMTHYHFYVYACFLILIKLLIMLYDKQYKSAGKLAVTALLPVILAIAVYPAIITHMQTSPRSAEAFGGLQHEDPLLKLCWIFMYAANYIIGLNIELSERLAADLYAFINITAKLFLPLLLVLPTLLFFKKKNRTEDTQKPSRIKIFLQKHDFKNIFLIFLPALLFCIVIAPTVAKFFIRFFARFFFFLMPIFCLGILLFLRALFSKVLSKTFHVNLLLAITIATFCLFSHLNDTENFTLQIPGHMTEKTYLEKVENKAIFWLTPGHGALHAMAPLFMHAKQVFPSRLENLNKISQEIRTMSKTEEILLFVPTTLKKDEKILQALIDADIENITHHGKYFSWLYYNVYSLSKSSKE